MESQFFAIQCVWLLRQHQCNTIYFAWLCLLPQWPFARRAAFGGTASGAGTLSHSRLGHIISTKQPFNERPTLPYEVCALWCALCTAYIRIRANGTLSIHICTERFWMAFENRTVSRDFPFNFNVNVNSMVELHLTVVATKMSMTLSSF